MIFRPYYALNRYPLADRQYACSAISSHCMFLYEETRLDKKVFLRDRVSAWECPLSYPGVPPGYRLD